jgi:hypothetical protein
VTSISRARRATVALLLAAAASGPASRPADPAAAQPAGEPPTVEQLMQMIMQRDAVIVELMQRVEKLEQQAALADAPPPAAAAASVAEPRSTPVAEPEPTAPQVAAVEGPVAGPPVPLPKPAIAPAQVADHATDQPAAQDQEVAAANAVRSAPGTIEVDPDDVERALERTLVETGALLLPLGKVEVQPSLSFERSERDFSVAFLNNGETQVGELKVRRDELTSGLVMRAGLPMDAQLELDLPYHVVHQSSTLSALGQPSNDTSDTGMGYGDLGIGLAKTLLRERGMWPDVVGRVRWDTGTGKEQDNGVNLGGGWSGVGGSLVASKRQDPLVFVGRLSYETTFENDGFDPGDEFGLGLGTVLAASPDTSLRFFLHQRYVNEYEVDGESVDGSDAVMATLSLGASSILGRGVLLDVEAGVGLTDDSPDYSVTVSLPVRFDLPVGY